MASRSEFYPPRLNPSLVRFVQAIAPAVARWLYWFQIDISDADLERLEQLRGQRLLLTPNHPTFHDPMVIFTLSAKIKQSFHYLAAYETFENASTVFFISSQAPFLSGFSHNKLFEKFFQWCLQGLGMYSVRRGLPDRPSIMQTIELFCQPATHLVIFPEGGCSFQNDTVMPFRSGGFQLALKALERLSKEGQEIPNLYVLPVTIKYHYTQDMQPVMRETLARLEQALDLPVQNQLDNYIRLRQVAAAVLARIEAEYHFDSTTVADKSWNERIAALKLQVIQAYEAQLNLSSASDSMIRERVYRIQYALKTKVDEMNFSADFDPERIQKGMSRLLNFDAIYDGYVANCPTPERFLDTLIRLEREVFNIDQPPPKGFRRAQIQLGEPINLKDHYEAYSCDRNSVIQQVTTAAHDAVQSKLVP
ncbi:MAG: lysophospholipid acyltransferase family protein [Thainema sp.]